MSTKKIEPIGEEALDKMIEVLEGPVNRAAEKILGSTVVLAPMSLVMSWSFRAVAFAMGRRARLHQHPHVHAAHTPPHTTSTNGNSNSNSNTTTMKGGAA